jgi:hypothetical protein
MRVYQSALVYEEVGVSGSFSSTARDCPWCESDASLGMIADGFGKVGVRCDGCGCIGPLVALADGDFESADAKALDRWKSRSQHRKSVDPDVLERLESGLAFELLMGGASPYSGMVTVPAADLFSLLELCSVETRYAGLPNHAGD